MLVGKSPKRIYNDAGATLPSHDVTTLRTLRLTDTPHAAAMQLMPEFFKAFDRGCKKGGERDADYAANLAGEILRHMRDTAPVVPVDLRPPVETPNEWLDLTGADNTHTAISYKTPGFISKRDKNESDIMADWSDLTILGSFAPSKKPVVWSAPARGIVQTKKMARNLAKAVVTICPPCSSGHLKKYSASEGLLSLRGAPLEYKIAAVKLRAKGKA